MASGIGGLIEEYRQAVAAFGPDTRESTLERAAERIRLTKHKVSAYSAYLQEERERLERDLTLASAELRRKVEELAEARAGDTTGPCVPA